MEYKIGLKVKTKDGFIGKIIRKIFKNGRILYHLKSEKFEWHLVTEEDIVEVIR